MLKSEAIMGIKFPPPTDAIESPKWDGLNFRYNGTSTPVLEYSENFSGWSDDLTFLHEEASGGAHPIDVASRENAITLIKRHMDGKSGTIMEIGCSSGYLLKELAEVYPKSCLIGADVVKAPLYALARDLKGVPLIRFDLLKNPLPNKCVDVLVMLNVLEHIEDDGKALKEAYKLLKPGGALIVEVPAGKMLYDSYDRELCHFRRYSSNEINFKLRQAGFEIERTSHLGFIVFPGFAFIKILNKVFNRNGNKSTVKNQAAKTSSSLLIKLAMRIESKLFSRMKLPFGVRVFSIAKK